MGRDPIRTILIVKLGWTTRKQTILGASMDEHKSQQGNARSYTTQEEEKSVFTYLKKTLVIDASRVIIPVILMYCASQKILY